MHKNREQYRGFPPPSPSLRSPLSSGWITLRCNNDRSVKCIKVKFTADRRTNVYDSLQSRGTTRHRKSVNGTSASAFLRHEYASLDIYRTIAHYDGEGTTKWVSGWEGEGARGAGGGGWRERRYIAQAGRNKSSVALKLRREVRGREREERKEDIRSLMRRHDSANANAFFFFLFFNHGSNVW